MQIRAFVKNLEGTAKQELNQSPLPFIESRSEPGESKIPPVCHDFVTLSLIVKPDLHNSYGM